MRQLVTEHFDNEFYHEERHVMRYLLLHFN